MSLLGIGMLSVGVFIALKVASLVIRLAMVVLILFGAYLLFAPMLGIG